MIIKKRNPFNGKFYEMDIPVTFEQLQKWEDGMLIQHAMPNLTTDQREFIMTGITPEQWVEMFRKGDEQ